MTSDRYGVYNCVASGSPPNTGATLSGIDQADKPGVEKILEQIAKDCEEEIESDIKHEDKNCRDKGTEKHKCCDRKIEEKRDKSDPQSVYSDAAFDKSTGEMIGRNNPVRGGIPSRVPRTRSAIKNQAIGFAKSTGSKIGPVIGGMLSGKKFPDVVVSADSSKPPGPGNTKAVYDFKFPCPKDKPPKWGDNGKQGRTYNEMLSPEQSPKMITPMGIF